MCLYYGNPEEDISEPAGGNGGLKKFPEKGSS